MFALIQSKRYSIIQLSSSRSRSLLLYIMSYIRPLLFIKIFFIFSVMNISAQDTADTTDILHKREAGIHDTTRTRFAAHLSTSYHTPLRRKANSIGLNKKWSPYFTGGIYIDFPTYISKMFVRLAAEAGRIDKKDLTVEDLEILHTSLSVYYNFSVFNNNIIIRPRFGLSNIVIKIGHFDIKELFHLTRDFESEAGFLAGFEPVFRIKRLQIAIPVNIDCIFSSPNIFITGNVSLTAGVVF